MLNLAAQMALIEAEAKARRVPIKTFCQEAGIAVSNWGRWKRGASSPTFSKWQKVEASAARLFSATAIPSLGDNSTRAGAASPDPNPKTSESLTPARGVEDPAAPAPADG
jgi:hypothetical protein